MRTACSEEKRVKIRESMRATKEKRSRQKCRVFKVKIDESKLSKKQKTELKMMFVEGKWIKNSRIAWARDNGKSIFECTRPLKHEIVQVRTKDGTFEGRELKYIGSQMAQQVVDEMKSNLKTIMRLQSKGLQRGGELRFISELKSLNLPQYGTTYKFTSSRKMRIQGVSGRVYVSGAGQFIGNDDIEIASAKLLNTRCGYYIAVTTFTFHDRLPTKPKNGKSIALDLGCASTVTYSDGRKTTVLVEESERLRRLQRELARRTKRSNNWLRTQRRIGREYEKMTNRKNDAANKIVAELKSYDNVILQDEQLAHWHKTGHGKKVQHSILGRLKTKIMALDNAIVLARDIPTTKICMDCGRVHDMPVSRRQFKCQCGATGDRDVHAAENMLRIAEMCLGKKMSVPAGRREFTREEFLNAYRERFSADYGTLNHEADRASARR